MPSRVRYRSRFAAERTPVRDALSTDQTRDQNLRTRTALIAWHPAGASAHRQRMCLLNPNEQLNPAPANCPDCEGEFMPSPRQIYCSPRCKSAAHRRAPASLAAHTCPVCENIFTANPRLRRVYCSPECRRESERQRNRTRDEERARRLGEHPRAPPPGPQPATTGPIDPLAPTAVRNCPHCDQPVTIVALLATQEAARPTITNRVTDIAPLRRLQ